MVAFALRADGWYLRQDIIWHKPNPMPESVTDRCTKAHEYIFLMSKSARYYYDADAIKQPVVDATILRLSQQIEKQKGSDRIPGKTNGNMKAVGPGRKPRPDDNRGGNQGTGRGIPVMAIDGKGVNGHSGYFDSCGNLIGEGMANKKSVWVVPTMPFSEAHFATFPEDLIVPCIKAGCPEGGIVLDPFMGAGTTALVAHKLNRNYIGTELNPEYCQIAEKRILPYKLQQKLF
jgi:DNA modification methylase